MGAEWALVSTPPPEFKGSEKSTEWETDNLLLIAPFPWIKILIYSKVSINRPVLLNNLVRIFPKSIC